MTNTLSERQAEKVLARSKPKALKPKAPRLGSSPLRNLTVTIKEAADMLGIDKDRAYEAAALGHIPTIPMGKRRVVPLAALERKLRGEPVETAA